ncbi:regulator of nonsense transcripts 3B [Cylas formicarius]|uniref:regulator of nonsense transcripts 3B n=1 Tax=Cylas formicarius TaxID=197179 RepID=UPI0029583388|nr:regulator of nonsense transcripts 3B [Cylas formicarius]
MTLAEHERRNDSREKPLTKVVIRRLPPQMTCEQFINQVSPVPDYNYIYMVKGDLTLGDNAFSRVYLNFVCPEDVYTFKERFDNYVFLDGKGHEYPAVVEFAPFQKIPKKRGKNRIDSKCNTIESDPYFIEFVASLNKTEELEAKPEYTLQLTDKASDRSEGTTPLLEYLKNKKAQKQKIREVRKEERERRRKEFDRKRDYKAIDLKKSDERSSNSYASKSFSSKLTISKDFVDAKDEDKTSKPAEKTSEKVYATQKNKDQFQEKRKEIKPRFPKKEYPEYKKKEELKDRNIKSRFYDESKLEAKGKRVKKYSEKREERKIEAQKAEQRKLEQLKQIKEASIVIQTKAESISPEKQVESEQMVGQIDEKSNKDTVVAEPKEKAECINKDIEKELEKDIDEKYESLSSKRIRNKDRPTIAIYRPGMLSKRKQNEG